MSWAWSDFNETAVEQARELAWEEREHVAHRRLVARERFEERAGLGEAKPDPKPQRRVKITAKQWATVREDMGEPVSQLSGHRADSVHGLGERVFCPECKR